MVRYTKTALPVLNNLHEASYHVRTALTFLIILIVYGLVIVTTALFAPLRLGEILQAAAFLNFSWGGFFNWIAQSPGGTPLHYLVQLPLAFMALDSRILLRIPSLISGLFAAVLFLALAKRVPLQHPLLGLLLFLLVPTHLAYATQGRPYEMALLLMLAATLVFFSLIEEPSLGKAIIYAIALTACLFTQPSSYLPAVGYVICLLGFANLKKYRLALWYALAATVLPLAVYGPYYGWAGPLRRGDWLIDQFPAYASKVIGLEALMSLDPGGWNPWYGLALMGLLIFALVGGVWSAMPLGSFHEGAPPPPANVLRKRAVVFCLAGGALVTFLGETAVNGWANAAFAPYQVLWALPGFCIVFCAALDELSRLFAWRSLRVLGLAICVVAILLCIPGDVEYLTTQPPDMAKLTELVRPQLTGDACVVFVSQRLSRYLFEVFDQSLSVNECQNFFHKRVVLAIHPFVRADQERDARVFFRGLDFDETNRKVSGEGKVITLTSQR